MDQSRSVVSSCRVLLVGTRELFDDESEAAGNANQWWHMELCFYVFSVPPPLNIGCHFTIWTIFYQILSVLYQPTVLSNINQLEYLLIPSRISPWMCPFSFLSLSWSCYFTRPPVPLGLFSLDHPSCTYFMLTGPLLARARLKMALGKNLEH